MGPGQTGGELLPSTEGYDYLGGYPFSVSPDGRWLLFSRSSDLEPVVGSDLEATTLRSLSAYVLYDLSRAEGIRVGLSAQMPEFVRRIEGAFVPDGGCWIPHADGWRPALDGAGGQYLSADPTATSPEWVLIDSEPYAYGEYCPAANNLMSPQTLGRFRIVEVQGRRVRIVDAEDSEIVLASHRAPMFPGTDIVMSRPRLSPSGDRLGYATTSVFGSLARPSRAFVLSSTAPGVGPVPLASSVEAIRWGGDDSTIYAGVRGDGIRGIYRWRLPDRSTEGATEGR